MSNVNFQNKEVLFKIVYCGPGLCGKTTNLQSIHKQLTPAVRSDLVTLNTEGDRTLFFDLLDLNLGSIAGFKTKFALYTVPGQKTYAHSRKAILRGVDGVVFVADSDAARAADNIESLDDLAGHLVSHGKTIETTPWVLQLNKRDLPSAAPVAELNSVLNSSNVQYFETIAVNDENVMNTLKGIMKLVIESSSPLS